MPSNIKKVICIGIIFTLFIFAGNYVSAVEILDTQVSEPTSSGKVFISLKSNIKATTIRSLSSKSGNSRFIGSVPGSNTLVYEIDGDINRAISAFAEDPNVSEVVPVPVVHALAVTSDDQYYDKLWGLDNAKVRGTGDAAWNLFGDVNTLSDKTKDIKVAVIDSGVDVNHPDLKDKVVKSLFCVSSMTGSALPSTKGDVTGSCIESTGDVFGHGTHVAGIIAASPNSAGIVGSGWNAKIISLRMLGNLGDGDLYAVMIALKWIEDHAVEENIKIVNMSIGGEILSQSIQNLMNTFTSDVWKKGVVLIAAAGNDGSNGNPINYPAKATNVIAVASLDRSNQVTSYSQYNDPNVSEKRNWVSVAAPGGFCSTTIAKENCILSDFPGSKSCLLFGAPPDGTNQYCYMQGTSMASPLVAGIAALIYAKNPGLTNVQVRDIIESTTDTAIAAGKTNFGAVDAFKAVQKAGSFVVPTTAPTIIYQPSATPKPTVVLNTPTPRNTPVPTTPSYPTTGPLKPPKSTPNPYPTGPYCPDYSACPGKKKGDADCNGIVDINDYNLWKSQNDSMVVPPVGNPNANFYCFEGNSASYFVDLTDFEIWRRNIGL